MKPFKSKYQDEVEDVFMVIQNYVAQNKEKFNNLANQLEFFTCVSEALLALVIASRENIEKNFKAKGIDMSGLKSTNEFLDIYLDRVHILKEQLKLDVKPNIKNKKG